MNKKYITKDNFKIIETPNFFEVDELIAETIAVLNQKGYKTLYSCSGHNNQNCYKNTANIELLKDAKKRFNIYIGKINKKSFNYFSEAEITTTYIKFDTHYDFPFLPNDFEYETANEAKEYYETAGLIENEKIIFGDTISKRIYFFNNDVRKDDNFIESEIKNSNQTLYKWAQKLPTITDIKKIH